MAFLDTPDGGIFYEVTDLTPPWEAAPETILFHAGVAAETGLWADWLPVLCDRYRLVRLDMRGMGRSAGAAGDRQASIPDFAHDAVAVARAAGAERFHFVGESFGGTVGLVLGLEHPACLRSLTVSNASHLGGAIRSVENWQRVLDAEGSAGWSRMMMPNRFFDDALTPARREWFERQQAAHPAESILHVLRILVGADLSDRLGALDVPTLLLQGDASPFVSPAITADLHARLPRSELRIFPHARHGLPFSHGRDCAAALREFLGRL